MVNDEVRRGRPTGSGSDPQPASSRRALPRRQGPVLAVVALGGGLGALARYGIALLLPTPAGQFPWATFFANVLGCLLMGVLMVLVGVIWGRHELVRPFLGVGVLGGFTTFSTYVVEIHNLLQPGTLGIALGYLVGTVAGAILAVAAGVSVTRLVLYATPVRGRTA